MWKVEVGSAYLGFEYEPVVCRCQRFIRVGNTVPGKVVRDDSLALAPNSLTR